MTTIHYVPPTVKLSNKINCIVGKWAKADKSSCGVGLSIQKVLDPERCNKAHRKALKKFKHSIRANSDVDLYMQALTPLDCQHRVKLDDAELDPDNYRAYALALDLDFYSSEGIREKDKRYGPDHLDLKRFTAASALLRNCARLVSRTKNGIRVFFILSHPLTPHEYVTFYANVCNEMLESYPTLKGHKRGIDVFGVGLVLDLQTCVSLIRIPFGIRDRKPVVDAHYFSYYARGRKRLDIDRYGTIRPASSLHKVATPRGYASAPILKRPMPEYKDIEDLPFFTRSHWTGGTPPEAGERDEKLFKLVSNTIYEYRDNLSPEQYFKLMTPRAKEIPGKKGEWLPLLWEKICRQYIARMEASGERGKVLDMQQQNCSGGRPFYSGDDYDDALAPLEALDRVEGKLKPEIQAAICKRALKKEHSFLNLPPGAGKSSMVPGITTELVKSGKKILILCPDNAHVERYTRLIKDGVPVYSYGYLINRLFLSDYPKIHKWMTKEHRDYSRSVREVYNHKIKTMNPRFQEIYFYDSRFEDFFIPNSLKPRPFSQYLSMKVRREMYQFVERKVWRDINARTRKHYDAALSLDRPTDDSTALERQEFKKQRRYIYMVQERVQSKTKALITKQRFSSSILDKFYKGKQTKARELAAQLCAVNLLNVKHGSHLRRAKKVSKLIMTRDKLPFLLEHPRTNEWLQDIDIVIHDEADGRYFFDREILEHTGSVKVYGDTEYSVFRLFNKRIRRTVEVLHEFFIERANILINADRGIELVLERHGFGRVKVFGADAPKIYDPDLQLVFHPGVMAKRTQRRNIEAVDTGFKVYSYISFISTILDTLPANFFRIADGLEYKKQPYRGVPCKTNTVRATGSNAMVDSEIASTVGFPHPKAVAIDAILTGETPDQVIKRTFENKINQIIGRNTGYRARDIVVKHPLYIEQPNAVNRHICFLPEKVRGMDLNIKVITERVYTPDSASVPKEFMHIFSPGQNLYPIDVYIRFRLDKLAPGTRLDYDEFIARCARELGVSGRQVKQACKALQENDYYRDYVFKKKRKKRVIYIRNDGYGVALKFLHLKMEAYVEYVALNDVVDVVAAEIQRLDEEKAFKKHELVELVEKAGYSIGYLLLPERRWLNGKLQKCLITSRNLFDNYSR